MSGDIEQARLKIFNRSKMLEGRMVALPGAIVIIFGFGGCGMKP